MVKQVKISNFDEVKSIMNAAARCHDDIGVHDSRGSIADAKSILGLMSLDYTKPVMLVSENERELESVLRALSWEQCWKSNHEQDLEKEKQPTGHNLMCSWLFFFCAIVCFCSLCYNEKANWLEGAKLFDTNES